MDKPDKPKKRAKSRALVAARSRGSRARKEPEMISLPKNWFALEYRHRYRYFKQLRKAVRGPISQTRRRMLTVKARRRCPRRCG